MINKQFLSRFFKKVDCVTWDLLNNRMAIKHNGSLLSLVNDSLTEIPFEDFGIPFPSFAKNVEVAQIGIGDIIVNTGDNNDSQIKGWVIDKTLNSFELMTPESIIVTWSPPKLVGFQNGASALIIKSPNSTKDGLTSCFQSKLMPLMIAGIFDEESEDLDYLLMMIMMQDEANLDINSLLQAITIRELKKLNGSKIGKTNVPPPVAPVSTNSNTVSTNSNTPYKVSINPFDI